MTTEGVAVILPVIITEVSIVNNAVLVETRLLLVEKMLGAKTEVKNNHLLIVGVGYRR
jgi:hypothetical protein